MADEVLSKNQPPQTDQLVAAGLALVTGGPVGVAASYFLFKGLKGQWGPWALVGIFAAPVTWLASLFLFILLTTGSFAGLGMVGAIFSGIAGGGSSNSRILEEEQDTVPVDKYSEEDLMKMTEAQLEKYAAGIDPFPNRPYRPKR